MAARRFVLIGAGQCAVAAAGALRARGFDGELIMVGTEAELPYERPPLSKGYLSTAALGADGCRRCRQGCRRRHQRIFRF
jgi:NADPH-dependent 2,4-dienoyl-CoA reductase/sulfur reductase-like enzyme